MWQFMLGCFIGANISLLIYAIILTGKMSDKKINEENVKLMQGKILK